MTSPASQSDRFQQPRSPACVFMILLGLLSSCWNYIFAWTGSNYLPGLYMDLCTGLYHMWTITGVSYLGFILVSHFYFSAWCDPEIGISFICLDCYAF
jgi:hypothetical protein